MSLHRFCERPVITIAPEQTVIQASQLLLGKNVGCLIVEEDGTLCGIVTDRDLVLRVISTGRDPQQTTVREVMTANPARITTDKSFSDLISLMHSRQVRRVPIVDAGDKVVGMVTLDDLFMLLGEKMSDMSKGLSAAIFRRPAATEDIPPPEWLEAYLDRPANRLPLEQLSARQS